MNFDSSCGFLFYHLHCCGGCQYVKGTKQILIAVCVVEFTGSHSNFLVCKLQLYTVNFTVCFCKCVYSFSVFFLQNYSGNHSCQNYFVKTTDFFLQCIHQRILGKKYSFHKILSSTAVFNTGNNKNVSSAANQHIRMISEGSCDTKYWSNDAENLASQSQDYIFKI